MNECCWFKFYLGQSNFHQYQQSLINPFAISTALWTTKREKNLRLWLQSFESRFIRLPLSIQNHINTDCAVQLCSSQIDKGKSDISIFGLIIFIPCQYRLSLVDTWWYWVIIGRYWLILGGTGTIEGCTRSVKGSKSRKYLGVRLKRSEIGQFSGFWAWWQSINRQTTAWS